MKKSVIKDNIATLICVRSELIGDLIKHDHLIRTETGAIYARINDPDAKVGMQMVDEITRRINEFTARLVVG